MRHLIVLFIMSSTFSAAYALSENLACNSQSGSGKGLSMKVSDRNVRLAFASGPGYYGSLTSENAEVLNFGNFLFQNPQTLELGGRVPTAMTVTYNQQNKTVEISANGLSTSYGCTNLFE